MKYTATQNKATRKNEDGSASGSTHGQEAASVAPPEYGIGYVDQSVAASSSSTLSATGSEALQLKDAPPGDQSEARQGNVVGGDSAHPDVISELRDSASAGRSISSQVRKPYEQCFGRSFSDVRVVADHHGARIADQLNARAVTFNNTIWFGRNELNPSTLEGRHLLAHELTHVIQQREGRGEAHQSQLKISTRGDRAEVEADRAASLVMQNRRVPPISSRPAALMRYERAPACQVIQDDASGPGFFTVTCDGDSYRVRIAIVSGSQERKGSQEIEKHESGIGLGGKDITLYVSVSDSDTDIFIKPTEDLSEAVVKIIANVLKEEKILSGVRIAPKTRIIIDQAKGYIITFGPEVSIGKKTGAIVGGKACFESKGKEWDIEGCFKGKKEINEGPGELDVTITVAQATPDVKRTSKGTKKLIMSCERITIEKSPGRESPGKRRIFIMYGYAESTPIGAKIEDDSGEMVEYSLPLANKKIQEMVDIGFFVEKITGHTSPEGPTEPSPSGRFPGNKILSDERAKKAKEWLMANCEKCGAKNVTPRGEIGNDNSAKPEDYPSLRRAEILMKVPELVGPRAPEKPSYQPVPCTQLVRDAIRQHLGMF